MNKSNYDIIREKLIGLGLADIIEAKANINMVQPCKRKDKWGILRLTYAEPLARKIAEDLLLMSKEEWLKAFDENKITKELPREPDIYYKRFRSWDFWLSLSKKKTWNSKKSRDWKIYKNKVWKLTDEQPTHLLIDSDKRGYRGYHLDHIISIWDGYKYGFKPEDIADITNLRFIPDKQNMLKGTKSE